MEPMDNIYLTKHRQIIESLTGRIHRGDLKPYDRLPSEKELCGQWQASRSTVRKALDQLTDRGKIFRVPGKGSFVSFPKISHQTTQVLGFSEKMQAQGLEVKTRLILREVIEPNEEIAAALKLGKTDRVLKIQRLRMVKGEPMALQTSFMPLSIGEGLLNEDLESRSLNQLIQERCNVRLTRSDVWVEAPIISRKEQTLLGGPRIPLFLAVVGVTFDQHDEPIRFSRGVFRGDRVRLKISDSSAFELNYSTLPG
jgi:GntR family transcriptional regulator